MFKPQPVLKRYYDSLDEGKFVALKCEECGYYEWPPKPTCSKCFSTDMEWVELSGNVMVEDIWEIGKAFAPPFLAKYAPYYGVLAKTAEGTPFTGIIFGITDGVAAKAKLPFEAKLDTLQLDGFKVAVCKIEE